MRKNTASGLTAPFQFRGTWIPAAAWELLCLGQINPTEMILVSTIDALSTDDDPCWASNEHLGKLMTLKPNSVGNMITRLVNEGLLSRTITKTQKGTCRRLAVVWFARTPLKSGVRTPLKSGVDSFPSESNLNNIGDVGCFSGDQKMPFFKHLTPDTPDDEDHRMAKRLIEGLQKAKRVSGPVSTKKWAIHFRRLNADLGGDTSRIDVVLTWYIDHAKDTYTPRVYSAATFRSKFVAIEDAMRRVSENTAKQNVDPTPIAIQIAERLRTKGWPKGSAIDLPSVVQVSLDAYSVFITDMLVLSKTLPGSRSMSSARRDEMLRLVLHLLSGALPSPQHFVEQWMVDVHKQVADWADWSGRLSKMAFRENHNRFRQYGRALVNDYCREPQRWDRMMELINANRKA